MSISKCPKCGREQDSLYVHSCGKKEEEEKAEEKKESGQRSGEYNRLAIGGLVLSIISIFGLGLAGLIGLILGIVALVQIKHTGEKGKGIAIAAIIIGFIWSFVVGIGKQLGY